MNKYYPILWQFMLALFIGFLLMISCIDNVDNTCRYPICFYSDIHNSWILSDNYRRECTRSSVSAIQTDGVEPLYLHTIYTDSITLSSQGASGGALVTRAAPVDGTGMYNVFGVSAYAYTATWDGTQFPNYMYDIPVRKSGGQWIPSETYYWPGEIYKMRFFAYAPKGNKAYLLSDKKAGAPTISCTIPADVVNQKDLLVASSGEISGNSSTIINFTFHHALTAVKFVRGDDMTAGTVKRVTLKNVFSHGVYEMENEAWREVDTKASFSQELNISFVEGSDESITTEAQTFMMIPQTLPDDALIEMVFNDGNSDRILTGNIAAGVWPMGKTVVYKVSATSTNWTYTLEVAPPRKTDYTFQGENSSYAVTSYKEDSNGKREPVTWKTEFSTDGQDWSSAVPDWLDGFTSTGLGGEYENYYAFTVANQWGNSLSPHTESLRSRSICGTKEQPYNLSNNMGAERVQNTANCYVISSPGEYYFPLVYGNAIKDESDYKAAYSYRSSNENILSSFVNHLGNPITSPWIYENGGCEVGGCKLLWQDAPLVSDVQLYNEGRAVRFTVSKATIQQGNAVIAVCDANNSIMWSWHIWVTDEDISRTAEVMTSYHKSSNMMPVNLGWCDGEQIIFPRRECKVRIKAGPEIRIFTIRQNEYRIDYAGNNPYYQWGRKDPLYPAVSPQDTKYWYTSDGSISNNRPKDWFYSGSRIEWIADGITNPEKHNTSDMQANPLYMNLWDISNVNIGVDEKTPVKSIYDPCPAGFHVPRGWEFNGFSKSGSGGGRDDLNVSGAFSRGWNFYCGLKGTGQTIFFPATGARFGIGILSNVGQKVLAYGSAVYGNTEGVFLLDAGPNGIYVGGVYRGGRREGALPIRPVRE